MANIGWNTQLKVRATMKSEFEGLHAVVTGAGSGIGLAVAKKLSSLGAIVFGFDISEGDMLPFATYIRCDVGNSQSVTEAYEELSQHTSVLDILANNAGIGAVGTVADATDNEWSQVMNINVAGIGRVTSGSLPFLRQSTSAAIVNTCSIAATVGLPKRAVYSASKGAVLSLTLAMAADFVKEGIRVNCVNPGTADTPWVSRLLRLAEDPVAERAALEARQPMGRLVSADEVANAILYLASPQQSSTTGTVLAVDGGMDGLRLPK
jgi:NAD(P)-dependent dehydrogenase (short-subunit alcohol dehydrogenase family)